MIKYFKGLRRNDKFFCGVTLVMALVVIPTQVSFLYLDKTEAGKKWDKFDQQMYRYQIPSGWLVRYGSNTLTFVPDAKHTWK